MFLTNFDNVHFGSPVQQEVKPNGGIIDDIDMEDLSMRDYPHGESFGEIARPMMHHR